MPDGIVRGSVIQRTFVAGNSPAALYAASVPLNELTSQSVIESDSAMRRLVAEVLAVPSNALLDEAQYSAVAGRLATDGWPRFWPEWWLGRLGPEPFWEEWILAWNRRRSEVRQEIQSNKRPVSLFAQHSIALLLSAERALTPYWFGLAVPPGEFRRLVDLEIDETAFTTAVACFGARLQRSQGLADFTNSVLQYDIPLGSSPRASSDSLLKLLDSGKKMCLAPMAAGGTLGVAQLSQGQYVAAILSVSTGSLMTLILLGSIAVGSLLVTRVAQSGGQQTGFEERGAV